ncbi:monooxygenase (plasmid) [Rhodococcus erythropolis R138]|uniref:flavin-containing monooxygenase n=1 Tax=Rhodococcus erythropolis TaxID=1833 RepID=UPI0004A87444|nr:NAD(P)/FAD-dependent oxidoreductase [Rhodococcus erythropolis]ALU73539.1 monooxygenase [Rhodococcus erythropolis R138]
MTETIAADVAENVPGGDREVELHAAIDSCDPAPLLMSLVHVTGDPSLLEEFRSRLTITEPGNHYKTGIKPTAPPGQYPADVIADIRSRAHELLSVDMMDRLGTPDRELFGRMATVATSERVDVEFLPILLEQAGFSPSERKVPVTVAPPAEFSVIVIGAGIVGINAAIKLGEAGFSYRVFESRNEIGGTWSRNTYPGAAVDTPSHYYSYSFELNPNWSKYYPSGVEYQKYLRGVVDAYGIVDNISFNTRVLSVIWLESENVWEVTTETADGTREVQRAAAVVTALGMLNSPNIPDIEGLNSFGGTVIHTAEWDENLDLTDKRVVVLGTGCTSVQVVANIVEQVRSMDVVVRSPHWIVPEKTVVHEVSDGERWAMANIPRFNEWFRLRSYWFASDNLYVLPRIDEEWAQTHFSASAANEMVLKTATEYLQKSFADRPDLIEKLTPDFRPYGKRIVKDPGFFKALTRDHVNLHRASFQRVDHDGVLTTEGEYIPADVIILATGFQLEFTTSIEIAGRDGRTLADVWEGGDNPRAYLGIQVAGFPNLFVTAGPNSAPNHGAGHNILSEEHVHYVIECLQYLLENDHAAMDVKQEVLDDYNRRVDEALDKTVWVHPGATVNGYYRNSQGRAIVPCPWRLVDYWTLLREPNPVDFEFIDGAGAKGDNA